ncbi:MAG TPA: tRNA (uridine(34)/cytosine(34)/5-carboxymethylaminomethyluridine(34)-2'-O)-methyltransferase TrmL [Arenimonas sp.]|nr:tRNA (uridine(34)/cytosine(34)/5-carboxymethylaminomethyluridine(34)-2'-O)-methyltransferase TrmL [Arenimonas sp.]
MLDVILYQPEIPPNTGNIIRLCANTGARLHLIEPLGFELDDARLRRAGLDYHEYAALTRHGSLEDCMQALGQPRLFAFSARNSSRFDRVEYRENDALLFGPETRGLPDSVLATLPDGQRLRLPMRAGQRSLNLSNAVAVTVFEAWRQLDYAGAADP